MSHITDKLVTEAATGAQVTVHVEKGSEMVEPEQDEEEPTPVKKTKKGCHHHCAKKY